MAIDITASSGRSLLHQALAQTDVDMDHHRLLNLDTSNLPPVGIPPTIHPAANQWLHDWDSATQEWTVTRPRFVDIQGLLTTGPFGQQQGITQLGTITVGTWHGSVVEPAYLPQLHLIRPPQADVNINNHKLTNVLAPTAPHDAVNKEFMDLLLLGLNPKEACRALLTETFRGLQNLFTTDDGVALQSGDRVLAKGFTGVAANNNGIYIAQVGLWQRADDANSAEELERAYAVILEGNVYAGSSWVQINELTEPISSDDDIHFVLFNSATGSEIIAGAGLTRTGNTLNVIGTAGRILVGADDVDIDPAYVGQTSINTVGSITTGSWHGDVVSGGWGGTGMANSGRTIELSGADFGVFRSDFAVAPPVTLHLLVTPGGTSTVHMPTGGTLATLAGVETLTNKRITKRIQKIASNNKPSVNTNNLDAFYITALAEDITSMSENLTGTPTDNQEMVFWIKDNIPFAPTVGRNIAWGASFTASPDLSLPTITNPGVWLYTRFLWNTELSKWVLTTKLNNIQ